MEKKSDNQIAFEERMKSETESALQKIEIEEKLKNDFILALRERFSNDDNEPELKAKAQAWKDKKI